jgi:hypothetical protein
MKALQFTILGRHGAACVALVLSISLLSGCSMNLDAAGPPKLPQLHRPSDSIRLRYCAERERNERMRAQKARRRDATLLGFSLTLDTAAATTVLVARITDDPDRKRTLDTVALTTGVVGTIGLLVTGIAHWTDPPKKHDAQAATATEHAIALAKLSDTEKSGAMEDTDDSRKAADAALKGCQGVEQQ